LSQIAERQGISRFYLEQLFSRLRKRGLVGATRGPGGGYRLLKSIEQISVADVIDAVDETVDATRCGGQRNCQGEKRCLTHDLWADLSTQIRDFLGNISLNELVGQSGVQVIRQWQDERADVEHSTSSV
jgi:Rrf2 family iron-sulfur cluster assembly transcriptional regulator